MQHRLHDQHPGGGLHPRGLPTGGADPTREVEKRAVRILLECFLVLLVTSLDFVVNNYSM